MKLTIDLAVGVEDGERGSPKPNVLSATIESLQNNQNGSHVGPNLKLRWDILEDIEILETFITPFGAYLEIWDFLVLCMSKHACCYPE